MPVAGDLADKVFAGILNKAKLSIEVQILSVGSELRRFSQKI
jgi:hypothetical protein